MTDGSTGGTHWLVEVARRGGLPGADGLGVARGAPISEAWAAVAQGTGNSQDELAEVVARHFRLKVASLAETEEKAVRLLPESIARRFLVLPLREDYRHLVVATADPINLDAEQAIGFSSGRTPSFVVAPPSVIEEAIVQHYAPDQAVEQFMSGLDGDVGGLIHFMEEEDEGRSNTPDVSELSAGPVARLANMILEDAVAKGASDIHIQPTARGGVVRIRVDGVLRLAAQLPHAALIRVVARMKILGRMDIADRLRPQDGRARIGFGDRTFDLRISTVPTRSAEKCVIRILDPGQARALAEAGIASHELSRMQRLLTQKEGIMVVTGPTGSGKTTTMYAALRQVSNEDINIMTVEDPIEYELPGLTQIQVEPKQGVTFASALRAILRQDPDVIFIGEIRDTETAAIAVQAALTGHLVLATLHTNDAVGAIRRLADLGLDEAAITQTLRGSVAQRLIRRACPACKVPVEGELSREEVRLAEEFNVQPVVRAVGCDQCGHTGYRGRIPIAQVMVMTPEIEELVVSQGTHGDLVAKAQAGGMRSLREAGAERVRQGITTLQELERVLGDVEAGEALDAEGVAVAVEVGSATGEAEAPAPAVGTRRKGKGSSSTEAPVESGDPAADEAPDTIRSLVVDDDPATRIIGKALLESLGHEVLQAGDGLEALKLLHGADPINLVVLDLGLPGKSGREVLADIRGNVSTAGIPVVVLTGSQDPEAEMEVMDAGADDYLRKPLDPSRFLSRVKAALRRTMG